MSCPVSYSSYRSSISKFPPPTHPLRATTPPPPYPEVTLTSLPTHLLHRIISHLSTPHLSSLSKTSTFLRTAVLTYLSSCRERILARSRSLQASVIAANIPNELVQEIFSYLPPLGFYNATQVCSTWRYAATYEKLLRKNLLAAAESNPTAPPQPDLNLKTLSLYLQASGQLQRGLFSRIDYKVSTLYLTQPGSETAYPEVHISENGLYFLAAEKEYPWRVDVYSTYRPVLAEDIKSLQIFSSQNSRRLIWGKDSSPLYADLPGFHEWDATPTYLLTLPETRKVVSASFGPAMYGGIEYDKKAQSYSKGVDLLVLFEGSEGRLYKIRPTTKQAKPAVNSQEMSWKSVGKRLLEFVMPRKPQKIRQEWKIWDSMDFLKVCPFQEGPMIAKLGESGEVVFATASHLEVWEGVCEFKAQLLPREGEDMCQKQSEVAMVWDKNAVTRKIYRTPGISGRVAEVFTGVTWHTELGRDVNYTICSTMPVSPAEKWKGRQSQSMAGSTPHNTSGASFLNLLSPRQRSTVATSTSTITTPTESFRFDYTNLVACQNYSGAQLFLGLTPRNTLSQVQILPTPNSPNRQPCTLTTKSTIPLPSTSSFFNPTHIAAVCRPGRSIHPIIVAATDSGSMYISIPPPCTVLQRSCLDPSECPSSSTGFRRFGQIPLETGGRITDLKISFRGPVWRSARRDKLHSNELRPTGDDGVLVVVVATDRGRIEICYFDLSKGKDLGNTGVGRKWDLYGEMVAAR